MLEDSQVFQRVLRGEREAYRILVERYQQPLLAAIRGILARSEGAEDIAQDVFLAAYENLATFDPRRGRFAAWLFAIARNRCLNGRKRRRPTLVEALPDAGNRSHARDSRHYGPVSLADIRAKVTHLYWPARSWSRFGR